MNGQDQAVNSLFGNRLRVRVSGLCIMEGQILMVKHHYVGEREYLWAPPGGGMKFGETAGEALKREFIEETGIEIEMGKLLFVNEFLDPPLHAIELFFEAVQVGGILKKGTDPEMNLESQIIKEVKFMSLKDLQNEKPINLHSRFRDFEEIGDLLNQKGYFLSKN